MLGVVDVLLSLRYADVVGNIPQNIPAVCGKAKGRSPQRHRGHREPQKWGVGKSGDMWLLVWVRVGFCGLVYNNVE